MGHADRRQSEYHAFLLRLWRDDARQDWHASLQSTATGQLTHFKTVDELFAFLDTRLGADDGELWPASGHRTASRSTDPEIGQRETKTDMKGG